MILKDPISLDDYSAKLAEWEGTPYRDTTMRCGVGVDCVRFVVAIADWLHGFDTEALPPPPVLPRQTSLHNASLAWSVVRWLRERYKPNQTIWKPDDSSFPFPELRPGDILCVKTEIHPGHAMIAGPRPNELWHSYNSLPRGGVSNCALSWCFHQKHALLRVWRPLSIRLAM